MIDDGAAMAFGGIFNLVSNAIQGNVNSWGQGIGYFASGAATGEATLYGGSIVGGAVLAAGNNLTQQISNNGVNNIQWSQVVVSAVFGAGTALLAQASSPVSQNLNL